MRARARAAARAAVRAVLLKFEVCRMSPAPGSLPTCRFRLSRRRFHTLRRHRGGDAARRCRDARRSAAPRRDGRASGRARVAAVCACGARLERSLPELDAFIDVVLNQPVSNRASRAQGRAFLGSMRQIFGNARVRNVADRVERHGLCGHHAPLFGAVLAALDVDADTAARLYLYQAGRTITSAAVRLGLAGVFDSQRVQASLPAVIDDTLDRSRHLEVADVAQIAPVLDLFQSTQAPFVHRGFFSSDDPFARSAITTSIAPASSPPLIPTSISIPRIRARLPRVRRRARATTSARVHDRHRRPGRQRQDGAAPRALSRVCATATTSRS